MKWVIVACLLSLPDADVEACREHRLWGDKGPVVQFESSEECLIEIDTAVEHHLKRRLSCQRREFDLVARGR